MAKFVVNEEIDRTELDGEPGKCPYCGSDDLDYHGPDVQDGMIFYDVDCCNEECENDFKEWYTLTFDTLYGYPLKEKGTK